MTAPIIIENYDPRWPERYEQLRSRIAPALGPIAVAIQHVGSTAIPGLAAKAIIDVDVILRSAADLPEAIVRLATLGYQHRATSAYPAARHSARRATSFPTIFTFIRQNLASISGTLLSGIICAPIPRALGPTNG